MKDNDKILNDLLFRGFITSPVSDPLRWERRALLYFFSDCFKKKFPSSSKVLNLERSRTTGNCSFIGERGVVCVESDVKPTYKSRRLKSFSTVLTGSEFLRVPTKIKYQGLIVGEALKEFKKTKELDSAILKLNNLLVNKGLCFIYMHLFSEPKYYTRPDTKIRELLRAWTREEFLKKVLKYFTILYGGKGYGDNDWMVFILEKNKEVE